MRCFYFILILFAIVLTAGAGSIDTVYNQQQYQRSGNDLFLESRVMTNEIIYPDFYANCDSTAFDLSSDDISALISGSKEVVFVNDSVLYDIDFSKLPFLYIYKNDMTEFKYDRAAEKLQQKTRTEFRVENDIYKDTAFAWAPLAVLAILSAFSAYFKNSRWRLLLYYSCFIYSFHLSIQLFLFSHSEIFLVFYMYGGLVFLLVPVPMLFRRSGGLTFKLFFLLLVTAYWAFYVTEIFSEYQSETLNFSWDYYLILIICSLVSFCIAEIVRFVLPKADKNSAPSPVKKTN